MMIGLAMIESLADNQNVACQGRDHGQTDHHGGQDLAGSAGVTGNAFNGAGNGQTLTDTGTECTNSHTKTSSQHTHREKAHCTTSV